MSGSVQAATPLVIDTGAFFARFDGRAHQHTRAADLFERIAYNDTTPVYRPLYTSSWVLDELATLTLSRRGHAAAVTALDQIRNSAVTTVHPSEEDFEEVYDQFVSYDDQTSSFTDHMLVHLAHEVNATHVFTFDSEDFRPFGLTTIPE